MTFLKMAAEKMRLTANNCKHVKAADVTGSGNTSGPEMILFVCVCV